MFSVCESSSLCEWFSDSPKNLIHTHTLWQGTSFIITCFGLIYPPEFIPGLLPQKLLAFSIQNSVNKLWVLCISVLCSGRIAKWKGLSWERGPNTAEIIIGRRKKKKISGCITQHTRVLSYLRAVLHLAILALTLRNICVSALHTVSGSEVFQVTFKA